jgi:hypothetical protein
MRAKFRAAASLVGVIALGLGLGVVTDDLVHTAGEASAHAIAAPFAAGSAVAAAPAVASAKPIDNDLLVSDVTGLAVPPPAKPAGGVARPAPPPASEPPAAAGSALEPDAITAPAQPAPALPLPSIDDPAGTLADLVTFARSGKGRLAIGAAVVLLVWLLRRHGFRRVPWFRTQLGGYVAGFGSSALLYLGGALGADMSISFDIVADALATGFAASGQHEAARDVLLAARARGAHIATMLLITAVSVLASAVIVSSAAGCGPWPKAGAGKATIDCAAASQEAIADLAADLRPLAEGATPAWEAVYDRAKAAGMAVGGCALQRLMSDYLARPEMGVDGSPTDKAGARATFERFRAEVADGAEYRAAGP